MFTKRAAQSPRLDGQNLPEPTHTAVIHDGNGTWFIPSSLEISTLTDEELGELEEGNESVLERVPIINLLELLPASFAEDPWIRWE